MTSSRTERLDLLALYSSSRDRSATSAMDPESGTASSKRGNSGLTCAGKSVACVVWYTSAMASAACATGTSATFASRDAAATPLTSFWRVSVSSKTEEADSRTAEPSSAPARATTRAPALACAASRFAPLLPPFAVLAATPLAKVDAEGAIELIAASLSHVAVVPLITTMAPRERRFLDGRASLNVRSSESESFVSSGTRRKRDADVCSGCVGTRERYAVRRGSADLVRAKSDTRQRRTRYANRQTVWRSQIHFSQCRCVIRSQKSSCGMSF